jgi:DNA-directed RNA polymerase subunit RPC12/RpoP
MKNENYVCRNCGKTLEVNEGIFIEGEDICHCEECHSILFTDEEWTALYNEYNVNEDTGEEGSQFDEDCYYWTTVPEN